jgi:hypothetical protein
VNQFLAHFTRKLLQAFYFFQISHEEYLSVPIERRALPCSITDRETLPAMLRFFDLIGQRYRIVFKRDTAAFL